ncbi:retinol dehydrogenase 16-like [Cuculus canorus]|uniref:retinol dehydrogenase 16-like n=1 Tax=Cuculus canorus TaxID=55661 RepID=UPI0023AB4E8C|nr:retinol dehydrogenase 16-like [Cuculus canorus]
MPREFSQIRHGSGIHPARTNNQRHSSRHMDLCGARLGTAIKRCRTSSRCCCNPASSPALSRAIPVLVFPPALPSPRQLHINSTHGSEGCGAAVAELEPVATMWLYAVAVLAGLLLLWRWHRERQTVPALSEKFVLITGCDSGFGNRLARQLDARGLRVLAACLTEHGAEQLRAGASSRLQTVLLDVTSSQSIANAASWVREHVGNQGLWGLVNNAGIAIPIAPNEWLTKDDFTKVLDVNLLGLIEVTLSLLPLLRRARGRVVNVASVAGRISFFGGGYCISKFGVEAFSDILRREMRPFGVQVSIIEPGTFCTAMTDPATVRNTLKHLWEQLPAETQAAYGHGYLEAYTQRSTLLQHLSSARLSPVTAAMAHALLARCPRSRYAAGWDAQLLFLPLSYCPSWLSDAVFSLILANQSDVPSSPHAARFRLACPQELQMLSCREVTPQPRLLLLRDRVCPHPSSSVRARAAQGRKGRE